MIPGVGVLYFTSLALQLEGHDDHIAVTARPLHFACAHCDGH